MALHIEVTCDDANCNAKLHFTDYAASGRGDAYRYFRMKGWQIGKHRQYCPDHRTAPMSAHQASWQHAEKQP